MCITIIVKVLSHNNESTITYGSQCKSLLHFKIMQYPFHRLHFHIPTTEKYLNKLMVVITISINILTIAMTCEVET